VGAKGAAIVSAGLIAATPIVANRVLTHHHRAAATHHAVAHKASGAVTQRRASGLPAVAETKSHLTRSGASALHERDIAHHRHGSATKSHDRSARDEGATRREHSTQRQKPAETDVVSAPALGDTKQGDGSGDTKPGDGKGDAKPGDAKPAEPRSVEPRGTPETDHVLTQPPLAEH
jgi:hypothetical protein